MNAVTATYNLYSLSSPSHPTANEWQTQAINHHKKFERPVTIGKRMMLVMLS